MDTPQRITQALEHASRGEEGAHEELLGLVYEELRAMAKRRLRALRPGQTLQATALVHEAWVKLGARQGQAWKNRAHYFGAAANAMRNILIDQARQKASQKRSAPGQREELPIDLVAPEEGQGVDLLGLDEHLIRLGREHPQAREVAMLRFFAGLTVAEIAEALGISPRSVDREWAFARAWLRRSMGDVRVPGSES